jgi:hypothetical protein
MSIFAFSFFVFALFTRITRKGYKIFFHPDHTPDIISHLPRPVNRQDGANGNISARFARILRVTARG